MFVECLFIVGEPVFAFVFLDWNIHGYAIIGAYCCTVKCFAFGGGNMDCICFCNAGVAVFACNRGTLFRDDFAIHFDSVGGHW